MICRSVKLFFQAEDGIRDLIVTGVQTVLFRSDRKSTRLNSSHDQISYAVFCLKKKDNTCVLHLRSYLECPLLLNIEASCRFRKMHRFDKLIADDLNRVLCVT